MPSGRWGSVLVPVLLATLFHAPETAAKRSKQSSRKKSVSNADRCSLKSPVAKSTEMLSLPKSDQSQILAANPQALFQIATESCEKQQNQKCFVAFNLFRERHPEMIEGYSNAGVALERMGRLDDAKTLYRVAMKKFPQADKAIGPLLNVLQMEAIKAYDDKKYRVALDRYIELVKRAPHLPDVFINLGNINEALQKYDDAQKAYNEAVKREPKNVKAHNALCRLLLMEVSGVSVGRFGISRDRRLVSYVRAKPACSQAIKVAPNDKTANMNFGMLLKEALDFDGAIKYLRKALKSDPLDTVVLTNLGTTLSRNNQVPEAITHIEKIIAINDSPSAHYSIGTVTAPYDRLSQKGIASHLRGQDLAVSRGPRLSAETKCAHDGRTRRLARSWLSTDSVDVDIVEMVDSEEFFGPITGPRTLKPINLTKTRIGDIPLRFIDKQTIALTMHDVSVEGAGGVMYTDCEVFLTVGLTTELPRDYHGANDEVVSVTNPVISVLHPSISNYYHFTAEVATRMILSLDYYFGENGIAPDAQLLLPPKYETSLPWEFLSSLGIKLKHKPLEYTPNTGKRYVFKRLHRIDWVQLNTEDPDNNDMWSGYLPSRIAVSRLRQKIREHQAARPAARKMRSPAVVYLCRAGVREVHAEEIVINLLQQLLGDNVFIHDTAGRTGAPTVTSLQSQWDLFESASVIVGAHGAGLTNMIYGPDNMSVIEYPMTPQCNRCFGYIAAILNLDYWIVPEIKTFYHQKYTMTSKKAEAIVLVIKKVLEDKGLGHLMAADFAWDAFTHPQKDEL